MSEGDVTKSLFSQILPSTSSDVRTRKNWKHEEQAKQKKKTNRSDSCVGLWSFPPIHSLSLSFTPFPLLRSPQNVRYKGEIARRSIRRPNLLSCPSFSSSCAVIVLSSCTTQYTRLPCWSIFRGSFRRAVSAYASNFPPQRIVQFDW